MGRRRARAPDIVLVAIVEVRPIVREPEAAPFGCSNRVAVRLSGQARGPWRKQRRLSHHCRRPPGTVLLLEEGGMGHLLSHWVRVMVLWMLMLLSLYFAVIFDFLDVFDERLTVLLMSNMM